MLYPLAPAAAAFSASFASRASRVDAPSAETTPILFMFCAWDAVTGSAAAARAGSERKRRNLGLNKDDALNFGGQQQELWCEGGEVAFIKKMIEESKGFAKQVMWFTSLVSRGENLPPLYRALTDVGAVKVVKKEMAQGQKQSRFIAWTFMNDEQRRRFVNRQR